MRKLPMEDASDYVKCVWSVAMRVDSCVIHLTPSIWSIVVGSHVARKSRAVITTVQIFAGKSVSDIVENWSRKSYQFVAIMYR